MNKMIMIATVALASASFAADANAWQRKGSFEGPYGGKGEFSRECYGGKCTTHRSYTGPRGNTWSRNSTVTTDGQGGWTRQGSATGPNGNTATFGGSGRCSGGTCSYQGGRSGPNGTSSWSGSASRY